MACSRSSSSKPLLPIVGTSSSGTAWSVLPSCTNGASIPVVSACRVTGRLRRPRLANSTPLASADCTDEQLFKTMAMFWQFERSVGALHGTWLLGYTFGSKGEYQEVEYLEIRQMYDEYKHARMYEDAMLQLGYVDSRRELFTHPWCQFS